MSASLLRKCEGYSHEKATEEEHKDKVSGSPSEGPLLQHPTVPVPVRLQSRTEQTTHFRHYPLHA